MGLVTRLSACPLLLVMLVGCASAAPVTQNATPTTAPSSVMPTDAPQSPAPTTTPTPTLSPARAALPTHTPPLPGVTPTAPHPAPASPAATGSCSVTLPNRSTPAAGWGPNSHGNGILWTEFWPENKVLATSEYIRSDGSIHMKWPWWRRIPGSLTVEGRRLDASAPPLRADVLTGYGDSGFQPSVIYFPAEGCWEVTGRVGDASLTFVTLVMKVDRPPRRLPTTPTPAP